MAVTETGPVLDVNPVDYSAPYEVIGLGLDSNLGNVWNSTLSVGDNTTVATAYTTTQKTGTSNLVRRVRALRMPPNVKTCIYYVMRVPAGALGGALTTGVYFELLLAIDPNKYDADIAGSKAYFDVCGIKINASAQSYAATTVTPDDSAFSTTTCIASQTAALPTTVGAFMVHGFGATNAALNTPAVGEWLLVRIRRLGDHQLDTNLGFIGLAGISAFAY